MIFGGNDNNGTQINSVELFNWETGKNCIFEDLPFGVAAHTGTVMNEIPVFCGGYLYSPPSSSNRCYKYKVKSQEWEQVDKYLCRVSFIKFKKFYFAILQTLKYVKV